MVLKISRASSTGRESDWVYSRARARIQPSSMANVAPEPKAPTTNLVTSCRRGFCWDREFTRERVAGISNQGDLVPANDPVQSWPGKHCELSPRPFWHGIYSVFYSLIKFLINKSASVVNVCCRGRNRLHTSTRDATRSLVAGIPQTTVCPGISGSRYPRTVISKCGFSSLSSSTSVK